MRQTYIAVALAALAACGGDSGSGDGGDGTNTDASTNPDSSSPPDASIDAPPAPAMITISGTVTERMQNGMQPVVDASIALYRSSNETTPLAMTTSAAGGAFSVTVDTGGVALVGYLKATKANYKDTYLTPAAPIATDTEAPVNMITTDTYGLAHLPAGVSVDATKGLVVLAVVDGTSIQSNPVSGATVTSNPAPEAVRYSDQQGFPSSQTSTNTDGLAYLFNMPPGAATAMATKTGSTFKPTNFKVWANALNTTLITP